MPRKTIKPILTNSLTLILTTQRAFAKKKRPENELHAARLRELHAAFKALSEHDQQIIEGCVTALSCHPRFDGYGLSQVSAFELMGALGEFLIKKELGIDGHEKSI